MIKKLHNIKAYLAYRLPQAANKIVAEYSCKQLPYNNQTLFEGDFVVADFHKKEAFKLEKKQDINLADFKFHFSSEKPTVASKETYTVACNQIISEIKAGEYKKAVLSRVMCLPVSKSIVTIYNDLCEAYPNAFVYLITIEKFGTWIGASPEVLLSVDNSSVHTTALAGTKTNGKETWREKEIEEQLFVTDFIEKEMLKAGVTQLQKNGPHTIYTGTVYHLKTDFNGILDASSSQLLLRNLHPTPATCGLPQNISFKRIQEIESHNRSLYCGFIGPITGNSKDLYVNLRCMQIVNQEAYIYIGGGITGESIPEDEWKETLHKSTTLSKFLA